MNNIEQKGKRHGFASYCCNFQFSLQRYGDECDWKIHNFIAQNIYLANIEGQKINVLLQIIFHKQGFKATVVLIFLDLMTS